MLNEDLWVQFKDYYSKARSTNPIIFDYIAVQDILELCARGFCNERIARQLDLETEYVIESIKEFFKFGGFDRDIDFDAKPLFSRHEYNRYLFCSRAHDLDKQATPQIVLDLYRINCIYKNIEREIEKYYART